MSIEHYMNSDVAMVSEDASLYEAAQLMKEKNVGSVVVVKNKENDLSPVGMLTDRDMVIKLLAKDVDLNQIGVKDTLTQELLTIKKEHGVRETIAALADKGVRRAPVVDKNNKVVGIITLDDLLILMSDELNCVTKLIKKQVA